MVKKLKTQKNKSSAETGEKTIDFSSLIDQTNKKLSKQNFASISVNTVNFDINLTSSDLEKKYQKKYTTYLREEFNFKIIKMFFNYISASKIMPQEVKNNQPFIIDFLKIITNLLMNEIDISTMAYLIENHVKWLDQNETDLIWNHLYNVCLKTKQITSDNEVYDLLQNILNMKNKGFISYYNKWLKIKKVPDDVNIASINEMYNELMKSNYVNQNRSKFINYNEAVDKILKFSEKQKKVLKPKARKLEKLDELNLNQGNNNNSGLNIAGQFPPMLSLDKNNSFIKEESMNFNPNSQLDIQRNNNILSLSRNGSNYLNTGYFALNMMKVDSGKSFMSSINEQNNHEQIE
jgi:hypothetical protein